MLPSWPPIEVPIRHLHKQTLGSALSLLRRKGGLKIRIDASVPREVRSEKFSLRMKDRRLDHAFALVLFLRGLRAEVDGADLRVLR